MSEKYKIRDQDRIYFITFAVIYWIDVFTKSKYRKIVIESLKHCQKEKGLSIHAWCIMSNHLHLVVGRKKDIKIEDIIRDFKKYTSVRICRSIEANENERRRSWMLDLFSKAASESGKHVKYVFWQNQYHPIELDTNELMDQKLEYVHNNPVKAEIVDKAEEYLFSSARDYYKNEKGPIEIDFIS